MNQRIKEYWEERAKKYSNTPAATTEDIHLRELEVSTITRTFSELRVSSNGRVLDIGCGDGYSTLKVAQAMPSYSFLGIDYSEGMIANARKRLDAQPELKDRVSFIVGDVTQLESVCGNSVYDVVTSDRCLINLETFDMQAHAIASIAKHIRPGGYYIAIENFIEGHDNMNKARHAVGLAEIPVRWHNLYFREQEFVAAATHFFDGISFKDFSSSYYFATRVIYSAMCQMRKEELDYNHEIHQLAPHLPWTGAFSPIRMAVMRRKLT